MREIKFRAWCKAKKKLYEVYSISKYEIVVYDISNQKEYLCEDCVLLQYTGLKDKNGVEIYEGDIVENIQYLEYEVKFLQDDCAFVFQRKQQNPIPISNSTVFYNNFKVIGNIYENPELLEQK